MNKKLNEKFQDKINEYNKSQSKLTKPLKKKMLVKKKN